LLPEETAMRAPYILAAVAAPLFALQLQGCSRAMAQSERTSPTQPTQRAVELTIYPDDFALVHEVRPVQLQPGSQKLQLTEVSKQLDPRSVMLAWPSNSDLSAPVSNSYDLGVNNDSDLMKRYLGKDVELVRYGDNGSEAERQKGRLMVASPGQTVIQTGDKFLINPPGTIEAPTQTDIVTIPQLAVQVESSKAESADLNVSYLTRGLSWATDYVAEVLPSDDAISFQCWATVTNQTGTSYPNAKVTLMAGQPNRAALNSRARAAYPQDVAGFVDGSMLTHKALAGEDNGLTFSVAKAATPESIGDLQAYNVAKPSDIVQDQMNRLMLLSSEKVPIVKEYRAVMPGLSAYGYSDYGTPDQSRGVVQMAFHFMNSAKAGLGSPLPAGILRVYGQDQSGSKRYLGAADVWNAPKDAKVDVTLANAFDLYTMRKVTGSKRMNKHTVRKSVEVTIHNAKAADADVLVFQGFDGKFKVVDESIKHDSPDASDVRWKAHVPAGKEIVLKFSADVSG
jgi:hypothetical protein